jgi:membrane protein implicated in regulation of membrane protease activity
MTLAWWHWFLLGLVLMAAELATPGGFYMIFFGIAAVLVGMMAGLGVGGPGWTQLLVFAGLSVGLLVVFRARLLARIQVDPQLPRVDSLVGEIGTASAELAPGAVGKVELRGSSWSARNVSDRVLAPGMRCRVVRVQGLMIDVAPEGAL